MTDFFWNMFIKTARDYPDNIAIIDHGTAISYHDFMMQSVQIGEWIKQQNNPNETSIILNIDKSTSYLTALMGVWYAGHCFTPMPTATPENRQSFIINETKSTLSLTTETITNIINSKPAIGKDNINPTPLKPHDLAYIIYTSGSTGQPKGVMVEHSGITNIIMDQIKLFEMTEKSKSFFYLSINFDASLSDIGTALLSGATLIIEPDEDIRQGDTLLKLMHHHEITHIDMPPSLLRILVPEQMPNSLETIIIGGEASQTDTIITWSKTHRLINVYGPTETTICSSMNICNPDTWTKPIIGIPVSNTAYYILDHDMKPTGTNVAGELYIGGIGLARGYLNKPELTQQKFVTYQGQNIYKTGDKVIADDQRNIEFIGRIDRQFKLRGQLIEPDEIESNLLQNSNISSVAIIKRPIFDGSNDILACFLTLSQPIDIEDIKSTLSKILPKWMMPDHFEILDNMPKTSTDKINYSALKSLPLNQIASDTNITPPETDLEKRIFDIWADVLGYDNFGIDHSFFKIGGDSIKVIELTLAFERRDLTMSPSLLSIYPTIKGLAHFFDTTETISNKMSREDIEKDIAFSNEFLDLVNNAKTLPKHSKKLQNILITGATGFLGAHILPEILNKADGTIICLIRGNDSNKARERLFKNLEKYHINLPEADQKRLNIICGDLSHYKFGLDDDIWSKLTQKIDTIYHCAALVNNILPYADMRCANVTSTEEILRFSCTKTRKTIHYASTLSVFVGSDKNTGTVYESDSLGDIKYLYGGYAQTKWAAEYLLRQVPKSACDIKYYRFGLITGNTDTGHCPPHDFLTMFLKGISTLGVYPDYDLDRLRIDITPINYAAPAMIELSITGKHDTYHIANTSGLSLNIMVEALKKNNITLSPIDIDKWRTYSTENTLDLTQSSAFLSLCRCLSASKFEQYRHMDLFQATDISFDKTNTDNDLKNTDISCPIEDIDLIQKYIKYILGTEQTTKVSS